MPKISITSRLHFNKHKPKIKQEPNKTHTKLPPNQISNHLKRNFQQEAVLSNTNSF